MVENKGASTVRLELYAAKLKNVAGAFKGTSDPYAVVTLLANDPSEKPTVLGKTEVIKNSLNPKWTASFDLPYHLGCPTRINVGIYDEVRKGTHKPMGSAAFEVGEVLGARGNIKAKNLRNGGTLYARITPAPDAGAPGSGGVLHLKVCGHKLANVDSALFSKTDPFFEILSKVDSAGGLTWQPVYRSKHIMNNLNPEWEEFSLDISRLCGGDLSRPIQFKLYDWQKNGKHTAVGSFETTVTGFLQAQVGNVSDTSKAFTVLKRGKLFAGKVIVISARLDGSLPASPSPSYVAPGGPPPGLTSSAPEALMAPDSYAGAPFSSSLAAAPAAFSSSAPAADSAPMYDLGTIAPLPPPVAPHSSMASASLAPAAVVPASSSPGPQPGPCESAGRRRPRFVEYLAGGMELELCIAVDFTGSNGDPRRPGTLHYIHPDGSLNDYEKAITAVGSIIAKYDHDQMFTVWGFGAKYGGVIQHCFQVGPQSELPGISGVLEGYRGVFRSGLVMSGPTVFAEVIETAAAKGRSAQEYNRRIGKQSYTVLLILSDGAVTDIESTRRAIHAASDAPLSIVIVGIGQADFGPMQFLDDFQQSSDHGRDIVQFVEFSKYKDNRRALTQATLEEIPDQCVDYFTSQGIMPLPPVQGSQMSLAVEEAGDADIDLNMNFGDDGEIDLANYDGAVYDDTKYGTSDSYIVPSAPPESPGNPYRPNALSASYPGAVPAPNQSYRLSQPYQPSQPQQYSQQPSQQAFQYNQPQAYQATQPTPQPQSHQAPPFSQALSNAPPMHGGWPPQQQPPPTYGGGASQPQSRPTQPQGGMMGSLSQALSAGASQYGAPAAAPAPAAPAQERLFHVRAPQGAYPGMQLQVTNPVTGQQMLVAVPQGVAGGGLFGVRY